MESAFRPSRPPLAARQICGTYLVVFVVFFLSAQVDVFVDVCRLRAVVITRRAVHTEGIYKFETVFLMFKGRPDPNLIAMCCTVVKD